MREEITEPKHWRIRPATTQSWSVRRRADEVALSAEAVDAALNDDSTLAVSQPTEPQTYPELVARIHEQLAVLDAQRVQLQLLLDKA